MTGTPGWKYTVGQIPHRVTAYERPDKGGLIYLRWRAATNTGRDGRDWQRRGLGFTLRDAKGRVIREAERRAQAEAEKQLAALVTPPLQVQAAASKEGVLARLTIRQGRDLAFEPQTGKYPTDTPHRREVDRALQFVIVVLGEDRTWDGIRKADLRKLWRLRIEQLAGNGNAGLRGAELVIARLLAVAEWLRSEELIPPTACIAPRHWKRELAADWREITEARADYEPARPRHTLQQMRAILAAAPQVDPRFALLLALGAELRLGQVVRARRSDLDLVAETFKVGRRRKKRGAVVHLTPGQLAAVQRALGPGGYLHPFEAQGEPDYPLFPQGQLAGGRKGQPRVADRHLAAGPMNGRTLQDWFGQAEKLAGVPHVWGRGAYGLRRVAVDAASDAGISPHGLKEHGGWSDTQVPDQIYRDQEAESAREEAKGIRARIRGEPSATLPRNPEPEPGTEQTPEVPGHAQPLAPLTDDQWAWVELNHRPHAYQACALTT